MVIDDHIRQDLKLGTELLHLLHLGLRLDEDNDRLVSMVILDGLLNGLPVASFALERHIVNLGTTSGSVFIPDEVLEVKNI